MAKVGLIIAYALAVSAGLLGTLTWLVMMMAAAPNSKPNQLIFIRNLMIGTSIGGLVLTAVAVWLVYSGHPFWGVLVACVPGMGLFGTMIYLTVH